jgi:hypothetical protein
MPNGFEAPRFAICRMTKPIPHIGHTSDALSAPSVRTVTVGRGYLPAVKNRSVACAARTTPLTLEFGELSVVSRLLEVALTIAKTYGGSDGSKDSVR